MNPWHLHLAARVLRQGGQVLHATEGVWGIAADPFNAAAVAELLALKGRAQTKGLIVIGADAASFDDELGLLEPPQRKAVRATWPGPVTWILPSRRFPPWITGGRPTVAARVPGHPQARALCRAFGGSLVSTSANLSRRPPSRNRLQARRFLSGLRTAPGRAKRLVYLLPGETQGRVGPSEIRTLDGAYLRGGATRRSGGG